MSEEFERGLLGVIGVLEAYEKDLVVVGGWVPLLYARHLQLIGRTPLMTRDIDMAVQHNLPIHERSIDELLKAAGLAETFKSRMEPPSVCYTGTIDSSDVEVEFITHERGGREGTKIVQPGLHASGLHYVGLLLEGAFSLDVRLADHAIAVRVPTPAAFVIQKALVCPKRRDVEKRAKDLYYIFEVIEGCRQWREWITAGIAELSKKHPTWIKRAAKSLDEQCGASQSPGLALILNQRPSGAFPLLDDEQFREYAFGEISWLRQALQQAGR